MFSINTETFLYAYTEKNIVYLEMIEKNTKLHRCSRANIIYCNYDNTRLIQDVGIGVGLDAFHQYSIKQRCLEENVGFMTNDFTTFNR